MKSESAATTRPMLGPVTVGIRKLRRAPTNRLPRFLLAQVFQPRFLRLVGLISATVKHFVVLIERTRCL